MARPPATITAAVMRISLGILFIGFKCGLLSSLQPLAYPSQDARGIDIKGVMKQLQTKKVRPSDASVRQINLPSHPDRKVVARFDGGRLSSDAGLLCLYALDQQHGLTAGLPPA